MAGLTDRFSEVSTYYVVLGILLSEFPCCHNQILFCNKFYREHTIRATSLSFRLCSGERAIFSVTLLSF